MNFKPANKSFPVRSILKRSAFILGTVTLLYPGIAFAGETAAEVSASRPPEKSCKWRKVESNSPRASVLTEDCDYGFRKISHSFEATALLQKFSDSSTSDKVLEIFSKDEMDSPAAALQKNFISKLSVYEQQHCVARKADPKVEMEMPFRDKTKSAWAIAPDCVYAAKIKKETPEGDMPADACGEFGAPTDSRAYFEFHDGNKKQFAWVLVGQDTPLFDEQSLEF